MKKLFHYVHCPFCIRVRMALGFLNTPYQSKVLPYDDEKTPLTLTGKKMLPIMKFENGESINESLDIIARLDKLNSLKLERLSSTDRANVELKLDNLGKLIHSLCMPYWIYTPEFDDASRSYFQTKKELKRGPFYLLVRDQASGLKEQLQNELDILENELTPFYKSSEMTIFDIMLASHVWGAYILPEFQFSPKIHQYLQSIKKACHFNYHEDFWKGPDINFRQNSEVEND